MSTTGPSLAAIDQQILEQAAEWLMQQQQPDWNPATQACFQHWHDQHPDHARAWQRACQLQGMLGTLPAQTGQVLALSDDVSRRRAIRSLVVLMTVGGTAMLGWRQGWLGDAGLRTATGEQQTHHLADGTRLELNTNTRVSVNITTTQRRLHLYQGEILVDTGKDARYAASDFFVQTRNASLQALGTQFSVYQHADHTRLQVWQGRVRVSGSDGREWQIVDAGDAILFNAQGIVQRTAADQASLLWVQGLLQASDMSLAQLVAELQRYFPGTIRLHPQLRARRVSGVFPVTDVPETLAILQQTHPLTVTNWLGLWISLQPRP